MISLLWPINFFWYCARLKYHFLHFSGDVRKTDVRKISRKTSLVIKQFELSSLPPTTILKTKSTANVCKHFQNCCASICIGINISKATGEIFAFCNFFLVHSYVPEGSFAGNFEKFLLSWSYRLTVPTGCNTTKNKLLIQFPEGSFKHFGKFTWRTLQ